MYRMKQNAVGLANICILSTMVLVMVSTTVSLYAGLQEILDVRYPYDITVHINSNSVDFNREEIVDEVKTIIEEKDRTIENFIDSFVLSVAMRKEDSAFKAGWDWGKATSTTNLAMFNIMTKEQYAALTGIQEMELKENEVCIYTNVKGNLDEITLMDTKYKVKENLESFPGQEDNAAYNMVDVYCMVVKDNAVLQGIYNQQKEAYGENASEYEYEISMNIDGAREEKIACAAAVKNSFKKRTKDIILDKDGKEEKGYYYFNYIDSKQGSEDSHYSTNGGFLFLGIFLGILFLMATTLIIYYKQISEGYDDKGKVGMTKEEVRESIRSQVLKIFFLPIVAAGIHVAAAFPMTTKLLALFGLMNKTLFVWCTIGTLIVFIAIYGIVYILTARVYYKIVS